MSEQHSAAVQLGHSRPKDPAPEKTAPFYKWLWYGWKKAARAFGNLLSRTVTTLIFLVAVPVFALISKSTTDPLELKPETPRWVPLPPPPSNELEEARNGF
jgi:hypothetical protein